MRARKAALGLAVASVLAGPAAWADPAPQAGSPVELVGNVFHFYGKSICIGHAPLEQHCDVTVPLPPGTPTQAEPAQQLPSTAGIGGAKPDPHALVPELWEKLAAIGKRIKALAAEITKADAGKPRVEQSKRS